MEEKNISINEKKITAIDRILNAAKTVELVLLIILMVSFNIGKGFYITANLLIIILLFIYPLMEFIKGYFQTNSPKLILLAAKLIASIVYGISIMYMFYKIVFSKSIVNERLYCLYNYIAVFQVILFTGVMIKGFIMDEITIKKIKAGYTMHLKIFLCFLCVMFFAVIVPMILCYQPKKVVSFDNLKLPSELLVMDSNDKESNTWSSLLKRNDTITDSKLIEDLQKEISKIQAENVRNLDRLNYEIRNIKNESYYGIFPSYKELSGGRAISEGIEEGYIYEILIHKNGEVMVWNFHPLTSPFRMLPEMYRVNLPEDCTKMIIQAIESGKREKD